MYGSLAQMIVIAQNDDFDSWMNILFIVVIAIFYLVGNILKLKSNKAEQTSQDGNKPAKTKEIAETQQFQRHPREYRRHRQDRAAQLKAMRAKVVADKSVTPRGGEPQMGSSIAQKGLGGSEDFTVTSYPDSQDPDLKALFDLGDTDELKKAILHYEILGKPVSLR